MNPELEWKAVQKVSRPQWAADDKATNKQTTNNHELKTFHKTETTWTTNTQTGMRKILCHLHSQ